MKKLLLLWLMIAPMSGMAQNESTPQDTTLYVNGRKIVIKEQGDKIKVKLYESASGGDTITNAQIFEGVYLNGQSTEIQFMERIQLVVNRWLYNQRTVTIYKQRFLHTSTFIILQCFQQHIILRTCTNSHTQTITT